MANLKQKRRSNQKALVNDALALGGWSITELAKAAKMGAGTLSHFLNDRDDMANLSRLNEDKLQLVLDRLKEGKGSQGFSESDHAAFSGAEHEERVTEFVVEPEFLESLLPGEGLRVTIRPH